MPLPYIEAYAVKFIEGKYGTGVYVSYCNTGGEPVIHRGTTENEMQASFSIRSSVSSEKFMLMDMISCLMDNLDGYITNVGEYPAWEFKKESHLRDLMSEVFEEQYGYKPVVNALHAGVECGLFSEKLPGLDCVSFGPAIYDIHTAKERLSIESVQRTWKFTLEVLKQLK